MLLQVVTVIMSAVWLKAYLDDLLSEGGQTWSSLTEQVVIRL